MAEGKEEKKCVFCSITMATNISTWLSFAVPSLQEVLLRPWETVESLRRLKPIKPALHNSS